LQTFVPYDDFVESASVLDMRRLGKQRVEVVQILNTLTGVSSGWKNHPAVRMWRNHEAFLCAYGIVICNEWTSRGYKDTCGEKIENVLNGLNRFFIAPNWWGGEIHKTHRSKLLSKYPDHYRQYWPDEQDNLDYYWPV
jgi:hypothetical protein